VWKSDGELVGSPATIWVTRLAPDGLSRAKTAVIFRSCRRRLLRRDMPWELPLIEGPCLFRAPSGYYLFYSAGRWQTEGYAVGFAQGRSPRGPFTKVTTEHPWLSTGPNAAGPGGQCIVYGADGATYLAYHAWDPGAVGYEAGGARKLHIDRFTISPGGPRRTDDSP
jgi:beta-xylosidase